jgi:SNF2 family DNA or RNA helicase
MGRVKAHPKRKAQTITIVGAAAHAALSSVLPDGEEKEGVAIVTPLKEGAADRSGERKKRRLRRSNAREDDECSDEDIIFETFDNEKESSKARRQLIFTEDEDESASNHQSSESLLSIQHRDGGTIINITSSAYQQPNSTSHELIKFYIPKTEIILNGNSGLLSGQISLSNGKNIESLLQYCNQSLNDDIIDIAPILRAFEEDIIEISLVPTSAEQISVSVNLLHSDKLTQTFNAAPPIPVPRLLPRNSKNNMQKFSKAHPSYILIQALGSIFKESVFGHVAKSCFVPFGSTEVVKTRQQNKKQSKSIITAGMVYSVVDNLHANEFEPIEGDTTSSSIISSPPPLDIPGLLPTLRPYQQAAVRWMLERETNNSINDEWELCWYVIINTSDSVDSDANDDEHSSVSRCSIIPLSEWRSGKSSQDEKQVLFNPFVGWIASTYEDAKYLMFGKRGEVHHPRGGVLAESMGLGKTVEVIACMLASRSTIPTTNIVSHLSPADEALRIYQSKTIIESRATLIVTPPSILAQWESEIRRHTTNLRVVVYPGVKDLYGRSSPNSTRPHSDFHLVNPQVLANADVVLLTFQTLSNDLGHSDDNPYTGDGGSRLRQRKRHIVLPSPLTSINWHRVVLDEAQRIESSITASAKMARKLKTERRWCVSGTPIGRGKFNDLHGLFLFLSFKPFDEKSWFMNSFILSQGDVMKRLSHLLRKVMWRSTKLNNSVRSQMGIPEQEEQKVVLHFSSVERYFYDKQYEEALGAMHKWSTKGRPDKLHLALNKLRAACCHPQVGASGISGRFSRQHQGSSSVLSMDEILNKLIDDSKVRCEEAQRLVVMHTNGLACLSKLKAESSDSSGAKQKYLEKSLSTYQEVIDLMDNSSLPTMLLGSADLGGSVGFLFSGKTVSCDAVTLGWQMKVAHIDEAWSDVNFTTPKRVSCVKIRPCTTLPTHLRDSSGSWAIIQPKECIIQVSNSSDGGGFVDVGSITLTNNGDEENGWKEISGFRVKRSKACRVVIKSYAVLPCTNTEPRNYYVGLDLQLFEPRIADDPLQRLHTLHNASMVLSSILQDDNTDADGGRVKERLEKMESEEQSLHNNYMAHAQAIHGHRKYHLMTATSAREKCNRSLIDLSSGSDRAWYEDMLGWLSLYGSESQQREMCEAVADCLSSYYQNMNSRSGVSELDQVLIRTGRFPGFSNVDGLHAAFQIRIHQGRNEVGESESSHTDQEKCLAAVLNMSESPSSGEINENSHCRRCRADWHQTGPVCKHCHLEDDLVKFERLTNDPELGTILKTMAKVVKSYLSKASGQYKSYLRSLHDRAVKHLELQRLIREELKAAKAFWRAHFDLLSDIDELNQCKSAMRLQREGEDVSKLSQNEAAFVVDPASVDAEYSDHEAKQALAFAEMRRSEDSLKFLMNQRRSEQLAQEGNGDNAGSEMTCAICLASFQDERSVLSCGHSFHPACVERLFNRVSGGAIRCPMRCLITTKREDVFLATNKSKKDGSKSAHVINGDWGTKVNRLIGDVLDAIQIGDKGIILSQWDDMLSIVGEALAANNIHFIRPHGGKMFGEDVKKFRSACDCPILLMNVKNGAEGLTLTEANHCFMLEPILNHSLDAQAINRIHRIGQTSKTYIYRYIMKDTVEEKIDAMRVEREANHFEDDIIVHQERKDHFDQTELDQIFAG